jgi:hypothetical protein
MYKITIVTYCSIVWDMNFLSHSEQGMHDIHIKELYNNSVAFSPRANYTDYTDRRLSTKLVPTFADKWCCVVSTTDPYGCIFGFLDWSR